MECQNHDMAFDGMGKAYAIKGHIVILIKIYFICSLY